MKKLIFAMAVVAAGAASAVSFSYQGALRTETGGPIPAKDSNKTITFRLYDSPTDGKLLWGRQYAVHLDTNGLFNVELSDTTGSQSTEPKPFTNDLAYVLANYAGESSSLYIGLFVQNSSGEIRPRQKLLNVPSAGFAADVATAKNGFTVTGKAVVNGAAEVKGTLTVGAGLTDKDGKDTGLTVNGGLNVASGGLTVKDDKLTFANGGIVPKGGIIMWSGPANQIPDGWALCDGTGETPNLKGRFIVGYDPDDKTYNYNGVRNTGGQASVKLTGNQAPLPEHSHIYWGNDGQKLSPVSHTPAVNIDKGFWSRQLEGFVSAYTIKEGAWRYETSKVGGNTDVGEPHENRPPYYVLCFIMKL